MKFIDFFAGIGGFRRGMELAGHECVGFCEFDKFATASYISMHLLTEEQRKTLEDIPIKKRQKEILKEEYRNGEWYANDIRRVYAGDIPKADCWCFGFPCQDISVAGKQAGFQGNRSSLFFRVMYLVGQLKEEDKPTYLFIENVKNLLSVNGGWDFARLLIEMEQWGYDAEWQVLNSKDFRVPQNRERCFIIGHLRGRSTSKVFPIEGTDGENSVSLNLFGCLNGRNSQRDRVYSGDGLAPTISTKPRGNTEPKVSIKIIDEINSSQDGKILSTDGIANCHSAGHRNNPKIAIPVLTPDRAEKRQNGRRFKEDGEPMFTLTSQDRHGVATSLNPLGGLYTEVSKEFYRGIYEGCFRCLKASTHDSGVALKLNVLNINSNKGIFVKVSDELIVYAVWYEKYQCYIAIRKLTPRECFRLQGWSDDYFEKAQFVNSDSQLYKQAGNGVTVTVIEAMARKMNVNLN
jgi:DNA (cytosine-5)-methyltransferase 1